MLQDDEKYKSLRNALKSLPRVKAKNDFETRLFQRIKEAERTGIHTEAAAPKMSTKVHASESWISRLFKPSFVPALGLTAVLLIAVVVYYGYFMNMGGKSPDEQVMSSDERPGEHVIYVKKDADSESIGENYPKEYSALTTEGTTEERRMGPLESPSDYISKPDPSRTLDTESGIKPDRVSEEQKLEMERSVDREKGVDVRGERKSDDVIMKKESKGDYPKGEMKNSKESPYNIRDEKEGYINKDEDDATQNQTAPTNEADKTGKEQNIEEQNQKVYEQQHENEPPRLGRVAKDSSKAKTKNSNTEAEQEDSTDQK